MKLAVATAGQEQAYANGCFHESQCVAHTCTVPLVYQQMPMRALPGLAGLAFSFTARRLAGSAAGKSEGLERELAAGE